MTDKVQKKAVEGKSSKTRGVYSEKGRWYARCYYTDDLGKRRSLKKVCQSEREARTTLKLLRQEAQKRKEARIIGEKSSLNAFLHRWLEVEAKPRLALRSFEDYRDLVARYVKDGLGKKPLQSIRPLDLKTLYTDLQAGGLSARVVKYLHAVLRSAFKAAVQWQLLSQNPCENVGLPKQTRKERLSFTPKQVQGFLDAAKDDKHHTMYLFALETGARLGEYLALQWADIDFQTGTVAIQRTLSHRRGEGSGWYFGSPKTAGSRRSIPLSQELLEELKKHRRAQLEFKMQAGGLYQDLNLVFASETGGPLSPQNLQRRHFKPILRKAGLPESLRVYDLRHANATLLLASGMNPKVVAERLGHSSIRITLDVYSHVLPSLQSEATQRLAEVLFEKAKVLRS